MVKEKCKKGYDMKRDFGDGLFFPFLISVLIFFFNFTKKGKMSPSPRSLVNYFYKISLDTNFLLLIFYLNHLISIFCVNPIWEQLINF